MANDSFDFSLVELGKCRHHPPRSTVPYGLAQVVVAGPGLEGRQRQRNADAAGLPFVPWQAAQLRP